MGAYGGLVGQLGRGCAIHHPYVAASNSEPPYPHPDCTPWDRILSCPSVCFWSDARNHPVYRIPIHLIFAFYHPNTSLRIKCRNFAHSGWIDASDHVLDASIHSIRLTTSLMDRFIRI